MQDQIKKCSYCQSIDGVWTQFPVTEAEKMETSDFKGKLGFRCNICQKWTFPSNTPIEK